MITRQSDGPSADDFEEILAQLGGAQALRDDPNDFRKAVEQLWEERDSLIELHPNKWVRWERMASCQSVNRSKMSSLPLRQKASAQLM